MRSKNLLPNASNLLCNLRGDTGSEADGFVPVDEVIFEIGQRNISDTRITSFAISEL